MSAAGPSASSSARTVLGSRLWLWLLASLPLALLAPPALRLGLVLGYDALIALLFVWEGRSLSRLPLRAVRPSPSRMRARVPVPCPLELHNPSPRTLRVKLEQSGSLGVELTPLQAELVLGARSMHTLPGQLVGHRHGPCTVSALAVRKETRLGLAAHIEPLLSASQLRVDPHIAIGRRQLQSLQRKDLGAAPQRMFPVGHGSELEALREYVATDPLRSVDWKATAKRGRPITRSYQPERSQTLWIVLDASRAMSLPAESERGEGVSPSRFEAALEAAVELADAALTGGDRVGLLVHARQELLCVSPRPGRAQLLSLLEQLARVDAQPCELDVTALIQRLSQRAPKRSFVVLFSDLDNEGDLRLLCEHAGSLTRRHLTLCMSLPARGLQQVAGEPVENPSGVYRKLSALTLLEQRQRLARTLSQRGLPVVESPAEALGQAALRRYRQVKLTGRL